MKYCLEFDFVNDPMHFLGPKGVFKSASGYKMNNSFRLPDYYVLNETDFVRQPFEC